MRIGFLPFKKHGVNCTDCGFLGWQSSNSDDGTITGKWECNQHRRNLIKTKKELGDNVDPDTGDSINLTCSRSQWFFVTRIGNPTFNFITIDDLISPRECSLFLKYEPGFKPEEHKELLRDYKTRVIVFKATIIGAIIGAVAAIAAQIITSLLIKG